MALELADKGGGGEAGAFRRMPIQLKEYKQGHGIIVAEELVGKPCAQICVGAGASSAQPTPLRPSNSKGSQRVYAG
eukprot:1159231-Pelagomonas_calceolata.AAC.8